VDLVIRLVINLLRNREIRLLLLTLIGITVVAVGAATYFISITVAFLLLGTHLLFIIIFLLFTRWRYRQLELLSDYLRQIAGGDYSLDVRDNEEGELSILKNDIYKMTLMLSEHSSLLREDKLHLMDAISDISHQLKTPLSSMLIMVDLLADPSLPKAKRTEFTRNLSIQLKRIEWLISSLLKLSKIDAGTVHFKKEPVQVEKLVHKALEPLLIPMDIKGQNILIQGEASVTFSGDFNWATEALINIVKNSVEHTTEGGTFTITFAENPLFTEIMISDNGRGIAKEDLPYIFKRFYRGMHAGEGSIGIGLALAHSIITSQNGTIEVESELDRGTTFRIKFFKGII
jgi:signal transduction histidine kinase